MEAILQGIRGGLVGTFDTLSAGCQKFSTNITTSTYWKNVSDVATPYFQQATNYYPESMKFNFSRDFAAGTIIGTIAIIALGAIINTKRKEG